MKKLVLRNFTKFTGEHLCQSLFFGYYTNQTRTLDPNPEKAGPRKTWTKKKLDPEKHGINIGLKFMSDFRELCFIKTMHNVIYCLKVRVLTDI